MEKRNMPHEIRETFETATSAFEKAGIPFDNDTALLADIALSEQRRAIAEERQAEADEKSAKAAERIAKAVEE